MDDAARPQIYLVTPPEFDPAPFADTLAAVLDAHPVACLRLALTTGDDDRQARAADALREVAHARDVPLVSTDRSGLAARLGLDGVHLTDGARSVRKARKALPADAIVGAHCGQSRHDGMTAGESGADYVAFGPVGASALEDDRAPLDLFQWWSETIELPVVAEGRVDAEAIAALLAATDFFALGEEIWRDDDPAAALGRLIAAMG
ncbi:thiamine phosphate synthase [Rhodobacteraceae bacterium CCMM004]|nr:thiamine phosphate synthase [Rhodobacteraceae bacterium CCMM004]